MNEKIIPFTELDYKQMLELRKEIFKPKFLEIIDSVETNLSDYDRENIVKIFDFLFIYNYPVMVNIILSTFIQKYDYV